MSTTVCQNTQSCFDTVTLKLNPPNPTMKSMSLDSNKTGWSYIETLSNTSHKETSDKLEVYVHPLVKRSMYILSDRSLEMCTENLGSETGSDITEDDIFFSMISSSSSPSPSPSSSPSPSPSPFSSESEGKVSPTSSRKLYHKKDETKKSGYESIPPPLTTMCGAHAVRVQPHRENGRLVMTVVTTSPRRSPILSERRDGRLTMSLSEYVFDDVETEEGVEEDVSGETKCFIDGLEQEGLEEEEVEEKENQSLKEDINGNNKEVGEKFGISEFQRLSRCKEGGHSTRRLINLETYWVAT